MTGETKFIIGAIVATVILVIGIAVLVTRNSPDVAGVGDRFVSDVEIKGLTATPENIDIGQVKYGGGIVTREYKIKNTTGNTIKLRKIVTSCMCTKARVKIGDKNTRFFSMEMNGDLNPLISYDLKAGETAKVEFNFDPAAHGPAGIGLIDRVVTLSFDTGFKELKFNGEVVK